MTDSPDGRSPGRWIVLGVACAVAVAALPLVPFAWRAYANDGVHGGDVRITHCARSWPVWQCVGDYEPGDAMTGDRPARGVLLDDPRHHAAGDLLSVQIAPDHRTVYLWGWQAARLVPFELFAGFLLFCAALVLWFTPLTGRRFAALSPGGGAAAGSLLLLVSVIAWALT
jgi:hypothetical protein